MMGINLRLYVTTCPTNSTEVPITMKTFDANDCSCKKKHILLPCQTFKISCVVNSGFFFYFYVYCGHLHGNFPLDKILPADLQNR